MLYKNNQIVHKIMVQVLLGYAALSITILSTPSIQVLTVIRRSKDFHPTQYQTISESNFTEETRYQLF